MGFLFPLFVCLQMVSGIIFINYSYFHSNRMSMFLNSPIDQPQNFEKRGAFIQPPGYTTLEVRWFIDVNSLTMLNQ